MTITPNTLLSMHTPPFDVLSPEHMPSLLAQTLSQAQDKLSAIEHHQYPNPEAFLDAVTQIAVLIGKVWGPVQHLFMVDNARWEETYQKLLPQVIQFWTHFNQSSQLYRQYKYFYETQTGSPEVQRALFLQTQEFEHTGIGLDEAEQQRCAQYIERISVLQTVFAQNHLRCKDHFCHYITDPSELSGLPTDFIAIARDKAKTKGRPDAWAITLDDRSIEAVLKHADHRPLRALIHQAYMTQASALFVEHYHATPEWDNSPIVSELLTQREEMAILLSYPNYAAMILSTRMADSADTVDHFLNTLSIHAQPKAQQEKQALLDFAREVLQLKDVAAHDIRYVAEKMREKQFDLKEEDIRVYFPLEAVLKGLGHICETIFHLSIEDNDTEMSVWHDQVRIKKLVDRHTKQTIGYLYLDLITREGKSSGAWMNEATTSLAEKPIAYLTCNFSPASDSSPSLLSHNDVLTLAHELGHCLNHLLNRSSQWSTFGNRGMEWDAVELQSQFMENFCWDKTALTMMSAHYQNQSALPEALYEKLVAARHFMTGTAMLRQIEFALFDMAIHAHPDERPVLERLAEIRTRTSVFPAAAYDRFPLFFDHIFAGGYAAGYYGYHWAEQLSSDVFAAFEEESEHHPILNKILGAKLRTELYERSGGRATMDCFLAFRGRPPSIDALLRHRGLMETTPSTQTA